MNKRSNNWPSPAKLNLFLHINGRLPSGYHQLQSYFQILDYGDQLDFEVTQDPIVELATPLAGVANEDNLAVKAAKLLQQRSSDKLGCKIWIHKVLPMGGGIGGGSSNAATVLVALNHLWRLNLSTAELAELGLALGADVPVFVHGFSAFANGVGERLEPKPAEEKVFLVVNPGVHVSTAEVFQDPLLPRNTPLLEGLEWDFASTRNDCQSLVLNKYPVIAKTLQWLLEYAPSRMTGTGASLFSVYEDEASAIKTLNKLPEDWVGFVAKGVQQSPLADKLNQL